MDNLEEIFYMRRYLFENLNRWILAATKMIFAIHYFSCGWILIRYYKKRAGHDTVAFDENKIINNYAESVYLMTTTISTIGYGDYRGFVDDNGTWAIEMAYMYLVMYGGILLFSLVTREIFTYKKLLTVNELVAKRMADTEYYLTDISNSIPHKRLPD